MIDPVTPPPAVSPVESMSPRSAGGAATGFGQHLARANDAQRDGAQAQPKAQRPHDTAAAQPPATATARLRHSTVKADGSAASAAIGNRAPDAPLATDTAIAATDDSGPGVEAENTLAADPGASSAIADAIRPAVPEAPPQPVAAVAAANANPVPDAVQTSPSAIAHFGLLATSTPAPSAMRGGSASASAPPVDTGPAAASTTANAPGAGTPAVDLAPSSGSELPAVPPEPGSHSGSAAEPAHLTTAADTPGSAAAAAAAAASAAGAPLAPAAALLADRIGAPTGSEAPGNAQASSPIPVPVTDRGFGAALSGRIDQLLMQGTGSAELLVTPRALGPIRIELSISGETASVAFSAAQPETRAAIEQSLPLLQGMLARHGLTLGETSVGQQAPHRDEAASASGQPSEAGPGTAAGADPRHSAPTALPGRQTLVDLYA